MRYKTIGIAACLAMVALGALCSAKPARRHTRQVSIVPPMASVAGIVVGVDTVDAVDRRLGPGKAYTGGHPRGARIWRVGSKWLLRLDGFEYNRSGGRVVDGLVVETWVPGCWQFEGTLPPRKRSSVLNKGYWRTLRLGTSYSDTLKWLKARKLKPKVIDDGGRLEIKQPGRATANDRVVYTTWEADLHFENKRLTGIGVSCAYE